MTTSPTATPRVIYRGDGTPAKKRDRAPFYRCVLQASILTVHRNLFFAFIRDEGRRRMGRWVWNGKPNKSPEERQQLREAQLA